MDADRKLKNFFPLIFLMVCTPFFFFAQSDYKIEHFKINDQLYHNSIHYIHQDFFGFIWLCTSKGLYKYDGYELTRYLHNPDNPYSIYSTYVMTIYEDPADSGKIMWIGTGEGLSKFDRVNERFYNYKFKKDSSSLKVDGIGTICKDKNSSLWLGGDGLKRFNPINCKKIDYCSDINKLSIYSTIEDHLGYIWAGSNIGLIKVDPKINGEKSYYIFPLKQDNPYGINRNMVSVVYEDKNNVLWIGTYEGLYNFDTKTKLFIRPKFKIGDPDIALISKIEEDKEGNIWASGGDLVKINSTRDILTHYPQYYDLSDTASSIGVNSFCIDQDGIIWVSLGDYGITKLIPIYTNFKHFSHDPYNKYSLPDNQVASFMEDNQGGMWIGTSNGGGLVKFDKLTNRFLIASGSPIAYNISKDTKGVLWFSCIAGLVSYNPATGLGSAHFGNGVILSGHTKVTEDPERNMKIRDSIYNSIDPNILTMRDATNGIFYSFVDSKDRIWSFLGTQGILHQYNQRNGRYIPYNIEVNGKVFDSFSMLFEDSDGFLWFGTYGYGLIKQTKNKAENGKDEFICYTKNTVNKNNTNSILSNYIFDMAEDSLGYLWIGTAEGLSKFDKNIEKFSHYKDREGLPFYDITGIVIDNDGNVWISYYKGLSKLDPETGKIESFNKSNGLQSNIFTMGSRYKDSEGIIYFGGQNGFNMFKPSDIKHNTNIPPIQITELQLFNKTVYPGENAPLKKSLEFSKEIILNYDQDVFTLEFSAIEYTSPGNNLYAYKMEGVDPDWVYTDATRRFATYTKLDPGEYKFKVKGSNNDGIWNDQVAEMNIIILSPWWKTNWAYIFYIFFTIGLFYSIWKIQTNRLKLKHQAEIDHINAEKYQEMDKLKSRFFANISHEFRTPLTLILGIIKKVSEKTGEGKTKEDLKTVSRNAVKLNNLVNQLLDLSKLEAGKMKLELTEENIIPLLKGMVLSFISLSETKKITLNFNSSIEKLYVNIDRNQFEKIINNLLINAFKFTPIGGKIEVNVDNKDSYTEIIISDTGIGIPKERLEKIFDRFYQSDDTQTREFEGTGIGLALTKELVELHKGAISVSSEEGKGTKFLITLPSGKEISDLDEMQDRIESVKPEFDFIDTESESSAEQHDIKLLVETEKPILLMVEDNIDVRNYIKGFFEFEYNLLEAVNGIEGMEKSLEFIPDIIISDVMMPKMDGFQLLEKLKTDERTNHIPVILLTAKASDQDKIEGLEIGADDYMMKPFDAEELQVRTRNLIIQRQRIREHFKKQGFLILSDEKIVSVDKTFLKKASKVVEKYISDSKFGVEQFSKEMAMSRQQLRRKFISLIGESPSDFIKKYRLTKAAKLIEQNFGNISEIAYEVGFENPAYFASSFKKQFGISPSQYELKNKN